MERRSESLEKINAIIQNHLSNSSLSGAFIAAQLGTNRMKIHRLLKSTKGCNAYEYITQQRIEFAQKRLRSSNRSIKEIALEIGFKNSTNFSRVFKKRIGLAPSRYRNES